MVGFESRPAPPPDTTVSSVKANVSAVCVHRPHHTHLRQRGLFQTFVFYTARISYVDGLAIVVLQQGGVPRRLLLLQPAAGGNVKKKHCQQRHGQPPSFSFSVKRGSAWSTRGRYCCSSQNPTAITTSDFSAACIRSVCRHFVDPFDTPRGTSRGASL